MDRLADMKREITRKFEKHTGKSRQKARSGVRLPAKWLYRPVVFLLQLPLRLILGVKVIREPGIRKIKGPVIILGNHPSYIDPFLAAIALPWLDINFVAASLFFRNKKLKIILEKAGAIPKTQFRSDATALKQMLQVLKMDGALGIFPEGQRSTDGTRSPMDDTISRLIKKTACNVINIKISGAYLTWPRWSGNGFRPGRIEVQASLLLSQEQIADYDAAQISEVVHKALDFDDYAWQRNQKRPAKYHCRRPAENMHNICHQCPACGKRTVMLSEKKRLYCSECAAEWIVDSHGFLNTTSPGEVAANSGNQMDFSALTDVHVWRDWQKNQLASELQRPDFSLSYKTRTETAGLSGAFVQDGEGVIKLDRTGLRYSGRNSAGDEITYFSPAGRTARFSANYGLNLEIPLDHGAFRFTPENGQAVMLLADTLALLDNAGGEQ
ncbi:MAG: 1-acyl-sn-glycerol-3-phosphate acyltransferase [Clostridiaceae bacterium]|nr:1-acyl-sn-glycerol-3-phosphate acyltransferase [Clostridiaceae bacterium]